MDANYFKDQICDELEGAKCYIMLAIEHKPSKPSWSKTLAEMSSVELEHATNLYKMFNEYLKTLSDSYEKLPKYLEEIRREVVDAYTECYSKVKYLHELYSK